jgi:P27 family predicted phage terminase small subunit
MRRGGPKPKPTVLHRLHGTLNPTRHRDRAREPIAAGDLEEPPADLDAEEQADWRYAIEHAPKGVLRQIDRDMLALWCKTKTRYRRAEIAQAAINLRNPLLPDVIRSASGALLPSPYAGIMNKAALLLIRLAEQMGFTPVSRPRLIGPEAGAGEDEERWMRVMDLAQPSNRA